MLKIDNRVVFHLGNAMLHGRPRHGQLDTLDADIWMSGGNSWDAPTRIEEAVMPPPAAKKSKKSSPLKHVKRPRATSGEEEEEEENLRHWFRHMVSAKGKKDATEEVRSRHPLTWTDFQNTQTFEAVQSYVKYRRVHAPPPGEAS